MFQMGIYNYPIFLKIHIFFQYNKKQTLISAKKTCLTCGTMTPIVFDRWRFRFCASVLGWQSSSLAVWMTRFRVALLISGWPRRARETVEVDTPAILAISLIVALIQIPLFILFANDPANVPDNVCKIEILSAIVKKKK